MNSGQFAWRILAVAGYLSLVTFGPRFASSQTLAIVQPDGTPIANAYLRDSDPAPYIGSRDINGIGLIYVTQTKSDEAAGEEGAPNQAEAEDPEGKQQIKPSQEGLPKEEEANGNPIGKSPKESAGAEPNSNVKLPGHESGQKKDPESGDSADLASDENAEKNPTGAQAGDDRINSILQQVFLYLKSTVKLIVLVTFIVIIIVVAYYLYGQFAGSTKLRLKWKSPRISGPISDHQSPGHHPQLETVQNEILTLKKTMSELSDRMRTFEVRLDSVGVSVTGLLSQVALQARTSPSVPVDLPNRDEGKARGARSGAANPARPFEQTRDPGGSLGPAFKPDATYWQEEIDRRLRRLSNDYNDMLEERADLKRFLAEWQPLPVTLTNIKQRVKEPGIGPELSIQDEPIGGVGEHFWWVSAGTDSQGYLLPAHHLFKRRTALKGDTAAPIFQSIFEVVSAGRFAVERLAMAEINEPKILVRRPGILHVP